MKLKIGKKEFDIKLADTEEKRRQGLLGLTSMPEGKGLLLMYDVPTEAVITMQGMQFPIGVIHIGEDKVQNIVQAEPNQEDIIINQLSDLVLEINVDEVNGIKLNEEVELIGKKQEGGKIDFVSGEAEPNVGELHVLNDKGQVQSNVKGNERVFSRKDTKNLIGKAKRAVDSKDEAHYTALGRTFVRIIERQDTQKQEYVEEK